MPAPSRVEAAPRAALHVDVAAGRLETAGHRASFDPAVPDDALVAYLKLVRRLRDAEREPSVVLRRDEVVALAGALRQDAVTVLDRLGELMGATALQRRSMVTAFLAGALLIAAATGAAAVAPTVLGGDDPAPATVSEAPVDERPVDEIVPADTDSPAEARPSAPAGTSARVDDDRAGGEEAGGRPTSDDADRAAPAADAGTARPAPTRGAAPQPVPSPATPRPDPVAPGPPSADDDAGGPAPAPEPAERVVRGPRVVLADRWDQGPEVTQPGTGIDIPPDDEPEVVQPGADIDLP